jgi:hypothetical protein
LQSLQMQTTIVLLSTVLQSVHSVFLDPHFGQFDMVIQTLIKDWSNTLSESL